MNLASKNLGAIYGSMGRMVRNGSARFPAFLKNTTDAFPGVPVVIQSFWRMMQFDSPASQLSPTDKMLRLGEVP